MVILVINDPHLAKTPPLGRVDGYFESILAKLEWCASLARGRKAVTVITGDLFHHKRATQIPYDMINRIVRTFRMFPFQHVYVVPGNHDLGPDGINGLSGRPLWTLRETQCLELLCGDAIICDQEGFVGYGVPYSAEREIDPEYYRPPREYRWANRLAAFVHAPILPVGEVRPYPHLTLDQIPEWDAVDYWFVGHIHECLGVRRYDDTTFVNVGSLARVSRTQDNMTRKPQVVLFDTDTGELEVMPVPHLPADRVFQQAELPAEGDADELVQFAKALAEGLSSEQLDLKTILAQLDLDPELALLVEQLLREEGL